MSIITSICFMISALTAVSMLGKRKDPFSPGRVFVIIWFTAIGLADFKFSGYQDEWSWYAWTILGISLGSFLLGLFICYVMYLRRPGYTIHETRSLVREFPFNKQKAFVAIIGLFVAYLVCYGTEVAVIGHLPIFAIKADRARIEYGIFGIHLIVTTMPTILFLIVQYFLLVKHEQGKKMMLGVAFLVTMFSFFLLLQRFLFVTWALMTLVTVYYSSHRFKFRWIAMAILVFYGMLQYLLSFRVAIYVQNFVYVISRMKYPEKYAIFTEPYMYIVMNIENFSRAVQKLETFSFGYFTGDPLLALTGLKHWLGDYFVLVERPFLNSSFNTFPFMWSYYHDFGIIGVTVLPLALGMAVGIAYYSMRTSPNPFNVTLYSLCFYFIVISFFTNPLTMLSTLVNIVVVILLQRWIAVPNAQTRTIANA
jgi:oligosaccharide repeat unit polymerase